MQKNKTKQNKTKAKTKTKTKNKQKTFYPICINLSRKWYFVSDACAKKTWTKRQWILDKFILIRQNILMINPRLLNGAGHHPT